MTRRAALAVIALALGLSLITVHFVAAQRATEETPDAHAAVLDALRSYQDGPSAATRTTLVTAVQSYGDASAERILSYCTLLDTRLADADLSDEHYAKARGAIDRTQTIVSDLRIQLSALDPATATIDQLRTFVDRLRDAWAGAQQDIRHALRTLQLASVTSLVDQLDIAVSRLVRAVEERQDPVSDDATIDRTVVDVVSLRDQTLVLVERVTDQLDADDPTFRALLSDTVTAVQQTKDALRASVATFGVFLRERATTGISLLAHGSGRASLTLTGHVNVFLGPDAVLLIEYRGGTMVEPVGAGERVPQGNAERLSGFSSVTIDGSDLAMIVAGSDYALRSTGTGTANLRGSGTYQTHDHVEAQRITPDGVDVPLTVEAAP